MSGGVESAENSFLNPGGISDYYYYLTQLFISRP